MSLRGVRECALHSMVFDFSWLSSVWRDRWLVFLLAADFSKVELLFFSPAVRPALQAQDHLMLGNSLCEGARRSSRSSWDNVRLACRCAQGR